MSEFNMKRNYQLELDNIINNIQKNNLTPSLLLHSCCAPCSSYTIEYLSKYFNITVFYYNPNIFPKYEYIKRLEEQKKFLNIFPTINTIDFIEGNYDYKKFIDISKGLELEPEGGKRCFKCYELRLLATAKIAHQKNFDYFTSTLSISPLKDAQVLNELGEKISKIYNINYLYSDFKKRNGFKRSIELSKIYNLYRQQYCGCIYSQHNKN